MLFVSNCASNTSVNLEQFRQRCKGKPFSQLIEHHINRSSEKELLNACIGTIAMLPEAIQPLAENFIDRWNQYAYSQELWSQDTASVFDDLLDDYLAYSTFNSPNYTINDEDSFNMFQIVVLSYAYSASSQPKMREFIGIELPWWKRLLRLLK